MPFNPGQVVTRTPANPTAGDAATYENAGFGAIAAPNACVMTPGSTGRVLIMWTGNVTSNATAQTDTIQMVYGTGTAPANNTAVTGTAFGGELAWVSLTGQLIVPFSLVGLAIGLTVGTQYYFDLATKGSAGTVALTNMNFCAIEV